MSTLFYQEYGDETDGANLNLVLHNPQEYVPMNTSRNMAVLKNGAKRLYEWWNQKPRYRRIGLLGCGVAAASVYFLEFGDRAFHQENPFYASVDLWGKRTPPIVMLMPSVCLMADGKIIVFTGLLDYFKTDAEIAAIIGHELVMLQRGTLQKQCSESSVAEDHFVCLPSTRRHEIEADYIGMLLMASAGYDPRVGIKVRVKFELLNECTSPSDDDDELMMMMIPEVMEEALSLYREALKEGKGKEKGKGDHPMSSFGRIIYRYQN
ncbi:hypothetical protein OROGR_031018 [Orobanche gracilis]